MQEFLKKYHIEAEAITPIFIGGGTSFDISKKDYYVDDKENKIYVINMTKFIKFLIKNKMLMSAYEKFVGNPNFSLNEFLNTNIGKSIDVFDIKNKFSDNIININDANIRGGQKQISSNKNANRTSNILGFIKNSEGNVYIPGSSIKGAIRTILLKQELINSNKKYDNTIKEIIDNNEKNNEYKYKNIENEFFNVLKKDLEKPSNAVNDKMCNLYISDSDIIKDELIICEKLDMNPNNKKEKTISSLCRECIKPNTKIEFDIVLKDNAFDINGIISAIKENVKWYHNHYINKYDKKCVYNDLFIPIGGGVGFLSKTFTLEASNNEYKGLINISEILNKKFKNHYHKFDYKKGFAPRTRKMAKYNEKLYDMGLLAIKKIFEPKTGLEIHIPQVF